MTDVPSAELLAEAESYAMRVLCTEIPITVGRGLTKWDSVRSKCEITRAGCTPSIENPISQSPIYNDKGEEVEPNMNHRSFSKFWKYMPPEFLVMKTTKFSKLSEVCARGNAMLQQWCEYPSLRAPKRQHGVTNVANQFIYTIRNGKESCIIPREYCSEDKGVGYDDNKKQCKLAEGQKFVEQFLISPGLYREIKLASDKRLKTNIQKIKDDYFGTGKHLYKFDWTQQAKLFYNLNRDNDFGPIADEFPSEFVEIDEHGFKNIILDRQGLEKLNIFLTLKNKLL